MNSRRLIPMRRSSFLAAAAAGAVLLVGGCNLDVENPNAPDAKRAFVDPAGLEQLLGGAFRTWAETRGDYFGTLPMTMMADSYSASWNNAAIRFYNSVGVECPSRCGWTNSATAPEAAGGPSVESQWYGYYTVLSSANDVLLAVSNNVCFDDDCAADNTLTSRNTAIAKMLQGMALAGISLIYDQGFLVDETTDLSDPLGLAFSTRAEIRDAALTKFDEAFTEAGLNIWTTESEWMGVGSGTAYTNVQIQRLIRTMQAELVAMWPRDATENNAANWGQVATFAAGGISSGVPFDFEFFIDASSAANAITGNAFDWVKTWGNALFTGRVDTRVAEIVTTNHVRPWPEAAGGNPCPTIPRNGDLRVGDGSYGPEDDFSGGATVAATANAGTDFACAALGSLFPPARGQYHQSELVHVRYEYLTYPGENLPTSNGVGQDPFYTRWMSDLLWAEGLIRSGGSAALAAAKINNSRVGRGGLAALTGAEGTPALLAALQYEQEIEFMGQGPTPFFNRRRIDGFSVSSRGPAYEPQTGTPLHMPVPAKEMDVLLRAVYTFGGPSAPPKLVAGGGRKTVRDRWNEISELRRTEAFKNRR